MKQANLQVVVNGQQVSFPLEAFDINVELDFLNDNIQPIVNIEDLTLYGDAVDIVNAWINGGLFYKGIPLKLNALNSSVNKNFLDAYINLKQNYEVNSDGTVNVGISSKIDMQNLNDRLESITWDMLESKGYINQSSYVSLDYVVEKSNNALEVVILLITIFIMTKELIENTIRTIDSINKAITASIPNVGVGLGAVAVVNVNEIIYAVLYAALNILYSTLILVAIVNMGVKLFNILVSPTRTHKLLNYKTGCIIVSNYLGYNFYSNISELDTYNYLPSNIEVDDIDLGIGTISNPKGVSKGFPKAGDFGYTALEWFNIMLTQFNAKLAIDGNTLIMLPKSDPYWKQNSTYQLPDIQVNSHTNNAKDVVFSKLLKYETDPIADEYTLSNFKGTNYQVLVGDPSLTQGSDNNFLDKHETINFNLALGNRKNSLNATEKILKELGQIIDNVTGIFGGGTNLAGKIKNKIGLLKVGTNNFTKAKCICIQGGVIPTNHRDLTSAKYLYDKYGVYNSFVFNNKDRQRRIFSNNNVPFGLNNLIALNKNGLAKNHLGKDIRILKLKWNILNDTADIEWDEKDVYAPNLFEQYIEQN